ncbi:hypothetical protein CXB51_025698 [Gossypium anomalum]|uniref:Zinc ion binding protein n=1 Tax=Gossypium anomalum TaxID=47600 RepID=A0A8J5YRA0_9ROSI|nr:hypothetical protein CXB51_025698 [Gossypium anomalum]
MDNAEDWDWEFELGFDISQNYLKKENKFGGFAQGLGNQSIEEETWRRRSQKNLRENSQTSSTHYAPNNPALLGLNVGAGIHMKLRLRRLNRDWDFYPFDQVLDTMLHELCHNGYGPHNASFYKLWDELRKRCEDQIIKKALLGVTGGAKSPKRSCKSNNLIPHQSSSSATSSAPMLNDDSPENQGVTAVWKCQSCTLLNPPLAPICKLCCTERPRDIGTKYKIWSCKFCTLENGVKLDKCSACDLWRYSHGAPISTPAPNVGTLEDTPDDPKDYV